MDQRRGERKTVALQAVIGCPRFGLIRGEIVDMSTAGVYVKAETSIVPIGSEVTVTFQPGDEISGDCMTLSGLVRHQSLQGFGIELNELPEECFQAIGRLLIDHAPVPARAFPVLRAV